MIIRLLRRLFGRDAPPVTVSPWPRHWGIPMRREVERELREEPHFGRLPHTTKFIFRDCEGEK